MARLTNKDVPVRPDCNFSTGFDLDEPYCPTCGATVDEKYNNKRCGDCGQALKW